MGMRRRTFLRSAAIAVVAISPAVRAQQLRRKPVIGYLGLASAEAFSRQVEDFRQGLAGQGFTEGSNIEIEYRWAGGDGAKLPMLAQELVRLKVDVISTAGGGKPMLAAAAATKTIPIVSSSATPNIATLARVQSNVTGAGTQTADLNPKRLELLHMAMPEAVVIAALDNPAGYPTPERKAELAKGMVDAAALLKVRLVTINADKATDFDDAFAHIGGSGAGALLVMSSPFFFAEHPRIVALANRSRLPAIYEWADIARNGGLMAYGDSVHALYRRAGDYVGRVLKGSKPADLPIDVPPKIGLTINLNTAQEIGFTFPPGFRDRAEEVIEG